MNIKRYAKEEIARNQIETALELFSLEGDLFSIVTLAGAAEEILGQLLAARKGEAGLLGSVLEVLRPASRKRQNQPDPVSHETEAYIHTDVLSEALFLLGRAIDDYQALTGGLSDSMARFKAVHPGS